MEQSDRPLLDLLRRHGPLTIDDLTKKLSVTATAVRARLSRLLGEHMVERHVESGGRGRPKHAYQITALAHRQLGQNYSDLAMILWDEIMHSVPDAKLRRVLFSRIADRLAQIYSAQLKTDPDQLERRMRELESALAQQGIEAEVARDQTRGLPILRQHSCPYYALAETDRAICAMERKMLEKVLGQGLRLSQCRFDGHHFCDFELKTPATATVLASSRATLDELADSADAASP